jgi:secondary thiamine-phosphate synthase enzyme
MAAESIVSARRRDGDSVQSLAYRRQRRLSARDFGSPPMNVETHRINVATHGNTHLVDLTGEIRRCLAEGKIRSGLVGVFVVGSTAAITTTEFEPGLVNTDFKVAFERIAPENAYYEHEKTWHDDNGHAHVRASITGPSLTVPLVGGELVLGNWQQIVLMDFDTRPRRREVVVQVVGE